MHPGEGSREELMDSKGALCWQPPSLGCLRDVKPFWRGFGVAGCAWAAGGDAQPLVIRLISGFWRCWAGVFHADGVCWVSSIFNMGLRRARSKHLRGSECPGRLAPMGDRCD